MSSAESEVESGRVNGLGEMEFGKICWEIQDHALPDQRDIKNTPGY